MGEVVDGAGVSLAYREQGTGEPVLLVHGMADDARAWAPTLATLAPHVRAIAYDRRGYGSSGAPVPYERTTIHEQTEDAVALLDALDAGPAVIVGVDIGGLIAVDLLLRHATRVRGAVLVDPAAYALALGVNEALSAERIELEEKVRDGGPAAAVESYVAARGADPERVQRAREAPLSMFADYAALATLPLQRRELRRIEAPVVVLDGPAPPAHARAASDALANAVPTAERRGAQDPAAAVLDLIR
jgi:pimeloyl-ACP methyl ester carboxylesterase